MRPAANNFQSYQGSIFTETLSDFLLFAMILSILSRFYFYLIFRGRLNNLHLLSILSRFYFYSFSIYFFFIHISFQSYQGSIFTKITVDGSSFTSTFQSYQGSIFTWILEVYGGFGLVFQSYQGSIFTRII